MPELKNHKWEMFANYRLTGGAGEAYKKAGFSGNNASQNAYNLVKNHPEIAERIEELKMVARDDARKETNDYIKRLDDIAWGRGEFAGENKPKVDQMISAMTKAMKAQGIEGESKINVNDGAGFQIIMHKEPEQEKEEDKDGESTD